VTDVDYGSMADDGRVKRGHFVYEINGQEAHNMKYPDIVQLLSQLQHLKEFTVTFGKKRRSEASGGGGESGRRTRTRPRG